MSSENSEKKKSTSRKCIECKLKVPSFNIEGKTAHYCGDCKKDGMVNTKTKMCEDCKKKAPHYNYKGQKTPIYCSDCKKDDMIDVITKKCIECKEKVPSFNVEGKKEALYCKDCKSDDMIDVKHKKCVTCKKKIPNFNVKGKLPEYCGDCKTDEMVDVTWHNKCVVCNEKQPFFNFEGEKNGMYCGDCKKDNLTNVVSMKCVACKKKRPNFNFEGEHYGMYCGDCKKDGMIDVASTKCIECKKVQPSYNYDGEIAKYCSKCKKEDMVDVTSHKKCVVCKIKNCFYNYKDQPHEYCGTCKKDGMINVYTLKCVHDSNVTKNNCIKCNPKRACQLCFITNVHCESRFKPYCFNCYCYMNPDTEIPRQFKIKEHHVRDYLKEEFKETITMEFDKKVEDGCSRRRPDVKIDFGEFVMIIEVDENRHANYSCENKRMMEIFRDCGSRNMVLIRFNPDSYKEKGKTHKGAFEITEKGNLSVKKAEFQRRMWEMVVIIEKYKKIPPKKEITVEQLFYGENKKE